MTYDNFTIKAQESILEGQKIAGGMDQQQVDTPHLLKGILQVDENVMKFLLQKMGVNVATVARKLDEAVKGYPKVEGGGKQFLTNDANKALSRAKKKLKEFGDEFISIELIILGILEGKDKGSQILKEEGASVDGITAAIMNCENELKNPLSY